MSRRLFSLFLSLWMLALPIQGLVWAQLTDDQQALLEDARLVLENHLTLTTYQQTTQVSSNLAFTATQTDGYAWATSDSRVTLELLRDESGLQGTSAYRVSSLDSDGGSVDETDSLAFALPAEGELMVAVNGEMVAAEAPTDDDPFLLASVMNTPTYPDYLPLLAHTTAIYDLGVEVRREAAYQSYQLDLDFPASLADGDFDVEAFTAQFAAYVDETTLQEAIADSALLTLTLTYDRESGLLTASELVLDISLEIETVDGVFALEYARVVSSMYE